MVDNNRRTKLFFKIAIGQLMVGLLVTAVALTVLAYAQGNRIDYKHMKVIRTGVIILQYLPKDSDVLINDKKVKTAKTFVRNLPPASYSFSIQKTGYTSWEANLFIDEESVNVYQNVILFRANPEISALADERKIALLNIPNEILASGSNNGLYSNDYEIWVKDIVISRFSTPIRQAIWYSDNSHVVYIQNKEIRVVEKNGQNDTLLVKLDNDVDAKIALSSDGQELYYWDGSNYKMAKIK